MATLAQYSAALHEAPAAVRPPSGSSARWFGRALYVATALLVVAAALQA